VKYAPVESVIAVTMLEQDYTLVPSPFKKPLSHWGVQSTGRGGGRNTVRWGRGERACPSGGTWCVCVLSTMFTL
jgi:hypothetical protein